VVMNLLCVSGFKPEMENLRLISDHVPTHRKPVTDEQFGEYLAGLIEGDGWITTSQPNISIAFHINDAPV